MKKKEKPIGEEEKEQYTLRLNESSRMIIGGREKSQKRTNGQNTWYYLGFVGEIGYSISIPIAGGALLGTYIDRHWLTYPKATLILILVGSIISILGFIRVIQEIIKRKN
jgi:predicted F0F1-ATPase subunit